MAITYTDQEITALIEERKRAPTDWHDRTRLIRKRGHSERQVDIIGDSGSAFRLIFRQNMVYSLDFSIILSVRNPRSNVVFRLRRYNGRSHRHTNPIEDATIDGFHIHMATERYQRAGHREDDYAELTDRYSDFHGALKCLLDDARVEIPRTLQGDLFEERQ